MIKTLEQAIMNTLKTNKKKTRKSQKERHKEKPNGNILELKNNQIKMSVHEFNNRNEETEEKIMNWNIEQYNSLRTQERR